MLVFEETLKVEASLSAYGAAWQQLLNSVPITQLVNPATLSVKVADKAALYRLLTSNAANIEQVHVGTVNDRYIASAILKEPFEGMNILKILERRAGSHDPLGLDSIDYLCADLKQVFSVLKSAGQYIAKEHNDMHAWLSMRFGDNQAFEAKFTDHLVLEVAIKELRLASEQLLNKAPTA